MYWSLLSIGAEPGRKNPKDLSLRPRFKISLTLLLKSLCCWSVATVTIVNDIEVKGKFKKWREKDSRLVNILRKMKG